VLASAPLHWPATSVYPVVAHAVHCVASHFVQPVGQTVAAAAATSSGGSNSSSKAAGQQCNSSKPPPRSTLANACECDFSLWRNAHYPRASHAYQ